MAVFERQPMNTRQQAMPLVGQLRGQRRQVGIFGGRAQQVGCAGRAGLGGHKVKQPGPLRVIFPSLPSGQKELAQAKASCENSPLRLTGPSSGQAAAGQKGWLGWRWQKLKGRVGRSLQQRLRRRQKSAFPFAAPSTDARGHRPDSAGFR